MDDAIDGSNAVHDTHASESHHVQVGQITAERYRILDRLGQGGGLALCGFKLRLIDG